MEKRSIPSKIFDGIEGLWQTDPLFLTCLVIAYIVVFAIFFVLCLRLIRKQAGKRRESETQITVKSRKRSKTRAPVSQPEEKQKCAVLVDEVYYHIRKTIILKNINLRIARGEIYGLLGPSGCGKTSLLRLVVGITKPKRGKVFVFGTNPGSSDSMIPGAGVGYMPQEIALYRQFTIKETLEYFGKIYGLSNETKNNRISKLVNVLDLPDENLFVDNISGGQKRRTSLAVALIHNPPLLILDEPTVGVDPVLRQTIWNYLLELTKNEGVTVIITTHYIEEARQANKIGLMRRGRLLIESVPEELLTKYKVDTLETAFLKICETSPKSEESLLQQKTAQLSPEKKTVDLLKEIEMARFPISNSTSAIVGHWNVVFALSSKSFLRMRRDFIELTFQLAMPALQIILFLLCVGLDPNNLKTAVYDPDKNFSLDFLQQLDRDVFTLNNVDSLEDAKNEVKFGRVWLAIAFDGNYTQHILNRFQLASGEPIANETLDKSQVKLYADMTEFPIQVIMMESIAYATLKFTAVIIDKIPLFNYINKRAITDPFFEIIDPPVYGKMRPNFREFVAPGMISSVTFMLAVALSALSFVIERKEGLLERIQIAGVKTFHIVLSHFLVQNAVIIIRTLLIFFCTFVVFNITLEGNIFLTLILVSLQGISGMSFGFLISAISRDEMVAIFISVSAFYPIILLSGIIWPLEGMPVAIKYFSYTLPLTYSTSAIRSMITRGWGLNFLEIWLGFIATLVWIAIFNISAIVLINLST